MHLYKNFLILHPAVRVCDVKPSEPTLCDEFSIHLHLSSKFKAMPSMSYELVAGADITCGSRMFLACWNIRPHGFSTKMQVNVATPSLHLIGACLAIIFVCLNVFTGRFSNLALIFLKRISFMVQMSRRVILILEIMQTGFGQENGLRTPPTISRFQIDWRWLYVC